MYLKEIKVVGFKSFADKTTLNFEPTITGIVGPNGSGKSNVVDAVRWVLGEQSVKALRGEGIMTDVIFAGTEKRSPLGRASVTITLDNSDQFLPLPYEEIEIKRTLYKDGSNEYFINGSKARLKDVGDLIIDSGLSKESFNIISQGEIENIINSKPQDRRVIFEDASNTLKYKKRKMQALHKMERANENITRLGDIISELDIEREPLKEQSEEAEKYLKIKNRLDNIELSFLTFSINDETLKLETIKKDIETKKASNDTYLEKRKQKELEEENYKKQQSENHRLLNELQDKLYEATEEKRKLENEKNLIEQRKKYQNNDLNYESKIYQLKETELKAQTELNILENKIKETKEKANNIKDKINDFQEEILKLNETYKGSHIKLDNLISEEKSIEYQIKNLENSLNTHSNLYGGVKAVLNNKELNGIDGVIGELVEASKKYAIAIDTALLSASQFIVTSDEDNAKKAINFLKKNNLGKATFFPLTTIAPREIESYLLDKIKDDNAYVDIASNLVEYDKKYYNIISNQLGKVIVAKDLDGAIKLSKKCNHQLKIVTLDGEVCHVGGSLSGGQSKYNKTGMIEEKLDLEKLKVDLKEIIQEIEIIKKELITKKDEISAKEEELNIKSRMFNELNVTYQLLTEKSSELKENISRISEETKSFSNTNSETIDNYEKELLDKYYKQIEICDTLKLEVHEKQKSNNELDEILTLIDRNIKDLVDDEKNHDEALKGLEILLTRTEMKLENLNEALKEDYNLTYEEALTKKLEDIDLKTTGKEIIKLKKELLDYPEVNIGAKEAFDRLNERYTLFVKEKEDLEKGNEDLLSIINQMDEIMKEKFKETFDKINESFKLVFNNLFKGGTAKLELTDKNDLLNTGIEIIASPPGKKLKHISLLSGGEKALTAISLLFGILRIKEIPFSILDEVEAALDESNVEHFANYLKSHFSNTQFILVTHKKKTMEFVDALYGVTMVEKGVSKLVSVKLK